MLIVYYEEQAIEFNSFMLIDEPTNHLDVYGRTVVADYLQKKKGFILVSHDRDFLNRTVAYFPISHKVLYRPS